MKQQYTAAELRGELAALENLFDRVELIDPAQMQRLDAETMASVGPCRTLPELDDTGRGWQPALAGGRTELMMYQAVKVDGLDCLLCAGWALPGEQPQGSRDANALRRMMSQYSEEMYHDYVTGVYNRRYLNDEYAAQIAQRAASGSTVSVAVAQVDDFSRLLQEYGRDAADRCLTVAAGILQAAVGTEPEEGIVARMENGTFLVCVAGMNRTTLEKRLRDGLLASRKVYGISLGGRREFTMSVAAAEWAEAGSWEMLLGLAQQRLLRA